MRKIYLEKAERTCPICKNTFYCYDTTQWVYKSVNEKKRKIYFCGWHCFNEYEISKEKRKKDGEG